MMPRTVVHYIDTTGPGGAETVCIQLAAGLRERGWQPHMIAVGPGWVLDTMRAHDLPVSVIETHRRLDFGYALAIRRLVRRTHAAVLHAHLFSPAVYASLIGASTGVPVVATFHGDSDAETGGVMRKLRYRIIDRNASVVTVSQALRNRLDHLQLIEQNRVRVIHNGVDADAFASASGEPLRRELDLPAGTFLVGCVGNVREAKDYPAMLRAAAALASDHRFAFIIAGERTEPLFGELVALRDSLGLADRVTFLGFRDDVASVMAALDVLVVSSSTEGFSLAAIQAMSAGTAVVATRSGGPEEIITNGVDGLLVPTRDADALAGAIRRIADDPALRHSLTDAARGTVARRFSNEAMLDAYDTLYQHVAG